MPKVAVFRTNRYYFNANCLKKYNRDDISGRQVDRKKNHQSRNF